MGCEQSFDPGDSQEIHALSGGVPAHSTSSELRGEGEDGYSHLRQIMMSLLAVPEDVWAVVHLHGVRSLREATISGTSKSVVELYRIVDRDIGACLDTVDRVAVGSMHRSRRASSQSAELRFKDVPWPSPTAAIEHLGVTVGAEQPSELSREFLHFAYYDPVRQRVHVCEEAIRGVSRWVETTGAQVGMAGLNLTPSKLRDVALWHEFYHVWMNQVRRKQRSWRFHIKEMFSRISVVQEEFSAVQFSRLAMGLEVCPQVLQWILQYVFTPQAALRRYNDIMKTRVI